jgi:arginine utilization protein RocB
MATSKAKRPVSLAQLQRRSLNPNPRTSPEPTELMPVKAHAYRAIAELNGGFEKVIQELQTLGQISYFRSDSVTAMHDLICRARAQANRDFTMALHDREMANAGHFDRPRMSPKK